MNQDARSRGLYRCIKCQINIYVYLYFFFFTNGQFVCVEPENANVSIIAALHLWLMVMVARASARVRSCCFFLPAASAEWVLAALARTNYRGGMSAEAGRNRAREDETWYTERALCFSHSCGSSLAVAITDLFPISLFEFVYFFPFLVAPLIGALSVTLSVAVHKLLIEGPLPRSVCYAVSC